MLKQMSCGSYTGIPVSFCDGNKTPKGLFYPLFAGLQSCNWSRFLSFVMASQTTVQYDSDKWGWIMVAVAFLSTFAGNIKGLGVLLIPITNDLDTDLWLVGWTVVLYGMMQNCLGPFVGALCRLVGSRPMMVLGGVLQTLGLLLTSVSPSVFPITIFIIGLSGLGSALILFIGMAVTASYFKEKYPLAVGLSMMGLPIGMMAYGPITQVLLETYGWRGATLLLGGVSFHLLAGSLLVRRDLSSLSTKTDRYQAVSVNEERENDQQEGEGSGPSNEMPTVDGASRSDDYLHQGKAMMLYASCMTAMDFAVLADARFVLLVAGRCTAAFAFSGFVVFLVSHGQLQGLSETEASFLPTSFGIGNVIGKAVAPFLQQLDVKPSMTFWECLGASLVGASFLIDAFIRPFVGQLAVCAVIGLSFAFVYQAIDVKLVMGCGGGRLPGYRRPRGPIRPGDEQGLPDVADGEADVLRHDGVFGDFQGFSNASWVPLFDTSDEVGFFQVDDVVFGVGMFDDG
ncbi:monocarboxylate transporter 3-like [Acanthaster planci]|uniref:Monocarboxylate transporter 3-like n=1 Tax=Acanthaster planci TaxID=133434 RepID=A0A8B7YA95_ACAPL|nr:monocarboxylate transporter 3-like [Acanthaster planci]